MSCPHLVPGNQCLDTGKNGFEYPICNCVHSYSISLWQTPFSNMSLAASSKIWIASEITKTMCTQGPGAHFCARVQRGVFTLVPCEYRTVNMINDYFVGLGLLITFLLYVKVPHPYASHTNTLSLRGKPSVLCPPLKFLRQSDLTKSWTRSWRSLHMNWLLDYPWHLQPIVKGGVYSISAQVLDRYPCSQGVPTYSHGKRSKTDIPHLHGKAKEGFTCARLLPQA